MEIELIDCERILLQEIADKRSTRDTIAKTYAFAVRSSENVSFKEVNKAIIERWSHSALEYIKNLAWSGKCFENKKGKTK